MQTLRFFIENKRCYEEKEMKIKSLFKLTKGHFWSFLLLIILVVFHRFSYSYVPLFTQYLIRSLYLNQGMYSELKPVNFPSFLLDFFESSPDIMTMALYVVLSLIIYQAFRFTLMFFEGYLQGTIQESVAKNLRTKLYDHIQNLSYKYHNNVDSGDLIQRVTSDVETTTGFIVVRSMELLGLIATLLSGIYQMSYINTTIMWICLAILPVYAVSSIIYFLKVEKIFTNVEEKESKMMTVIQENVSASKVVKAFANEPFEIKKMDEKNIDHTKANIHATNIVAGYWGSMDFISLLQYTVITILCIEYVRNGVMDAPSVVAVLMLLGLLVWPIRGLGRLINDFSKAVVAIGRIDHIFEQKSEYLIDGAMEPKIHGHIVFDQVSFKFEDDKEYLLKNISFEIKPGETAAFIGKTGSGKSTIINLLMRMYE